MSPAQLPLDARVHAVMQQVSQPVRMGISSFLYTDVAHLNRLRGSITACLKPLEQRQYLGPQCSRTAAAGAEARGKRTDSMTSTHYILSSSSVLLLIGKTA